MAGVGCSYHIYNCLYEHKTVRNVKKFLFLLHENLLDDAVAIAYNIDAGLQRAEALAVDAVDDDVGVPVKASVDVKVSVNLVDAGGLVAFHTVLGDGEHGGMSAAGAAQSERAHSFRAVGLKRLAEQRLWRLGVGL